MKYEKIIFTCCSSSNFCRIFFPLLAEAYFGGKIGLGLIDDACSASGPCDDDAFGFGVYGGYHFTERWGLELGFDSIGEFESSHYYNNTTKYVDSRLTALSLTPRYTFTATDTIDVFLKVGAAYMDYSRANDVVFTAGVGSELAISESLALRLEYQYFDDIDDSYIYDLSSHFISFGLTYTFGSASNSEPQAALIEEEEIEVVAEPEKQMTDSMEPMAEEKGKRAGNYTLSFTFQGKSESISGDPTHKRSRQYLI
ncbi:hypothetical protein EIJ81_08240 [Aliivibrio salmonicida]|uniref:outer membrane beta-barrel protein n=1 Tax=Aliivibrio salmonicida TaxID=40269 RepID=UPI000F700B0D|nr:hypothetical protein EIJ81_08240 [Aliivibrio salmonicida]